MTGAVAVHAGEDTVLALSRDSIAKGSKSFAMASRLLPKAIRNDAVMLYAWCRHCDDVIDDQDFGFKSVSASSMEPRARLSELRRKTGAALDGEASEPVYIALSRVVRRHAIPSRHPFELLDGFEMDVAGRTYRTLDDTLGYCYHVAGVVGVMMAMIMGVRDGPNLNRASDLGLAFQLTNIARDVMDDAAAGRIYLPLDWLQEAGVPPEDVAGKEHRGAVFGVTERLLIEADGYYRSALYGMTSLPLGAAAGIGTARRVYRDIGGIVLKRRDAAWDSRAAVGKSGKAAAAISGMAAALRAHTELRLRKAPSRSGLWTMPGLGAGSSVSKPI